MDFQDLRTASALLGTLDVPYFYIGGWGIDLFLGYESRSHSDIELTIYRHQQKSLFSWAKSPEIVNAGYSLHVIDPPGTATMPIWDGQLLELPIHQLQLYHSSNRVLDIMLSEARGSTWVFRRDPAITAHRQQIERIHPYNLPYHAPEVLLLYKSKRNASKDRQDRNLAWPKMTGTQQQWLIEALRLYDFRHSWITDLLPL